MTTADQHDLVDKVIADHREVEAVFRELEQNDAAPNRHELVEHAIAELVRHAVAEEEYLYPLVRHILPDGDTLANEKLKEHSDAEWVMKRIEGSYGDDQKFEELVVKLIEGVRRHIEAEERDVLPKLRDSCDAAELRRLGEKFEHSKRTAPTRPHPSAPNRPPFNKILAPGEGLIDRLRDALTGRKA